MPTVDLSNYEKKFIVDLLTVATKSVKEIFPEEDTSNVKKLIKKIKGAK